MKKYIKYFGGFTLMLIVLAVGVFLGSLLEEYKTNQVNGNLYNSTKIAVVNLDESVKYQKEQRNFAKELLENYSDNYVMTGLEDAKTGITDGRYAAYVILPSDFSTNVASINTTPQKSLLKYEISGDLSQNANDKAWQNVMELKEQLNKDVGYVYINSILNEFHEGQTNALKVLSNDSADKDVIMAISNVDLIATLDIKEVERLQNNIEDLDVNPDFEKNEAIISAIDTTYKGYMNETASELTSLKEENSNVNSDIANITSNAATIEGVFKTDDSSNYMLTSTETKMTTFKALLGNNIQSVDKLIEHAESSSTSGTDKLKGSVSTILDSINKDTTDAHNTVLKKQSDDIKSIITKNFLYDKTETTLDLSTYAEVNKIAEASDNEKSDYITAQNKVTRKIIEGCQDYIDNPPLVGVDEPLRNRLIALYETDSDMQSDIKIIGRFQNNPEADKFTFEEYLDYIINNPTPFSTDTETLFTTKLQTALNTDLEKKQSEVLSQIADNDLNDTLATDLTTKVQEAKTKLNGFESFDATLLKGGVAGLQTVASTMSYGVINNTVKDDLTPLNNKQVKQKSNLLDSINLHQTLSDKLTSNIILYDPIKNTDDKEIEQYVREINTNSHETQRKIENKNREYTTFVTDSYSNANEQVNSLRKDVSEYQKQSDEKVTTGLETAKKKKNETSSSNSKLMGSYINKLPYTRNGTVGNTVVYDFITAPSDMEGLKAENSMTTSSFNFPILFLGISIILVVAWGILYLISRKGKQKK